MTDSSTDSPSVGRGLPTQLDPSDGNGEKNKRKKKVPPQKKKKRENLPRLEKTPTKGGDKVGIRVNSPYLQEKNPPSK